ncbi:MULTISPECIES: hypothetical protein [Nostocales]|jgi:hypothetical protein|uniref:Uncharacterized protein n=1 Tax=Dolichospermum flos-aquae UHCC 0037 TaxID=2590026 RepID=A0ACC7S922_DOLFA|nr:MULTISPECIES: hypothetical protein [Nostocales]KHG41954.1 hypothetical protein OA07_08160 [Aphanizomenon flos-aquae 2012/KM1/D3]MBO1065154.1 hypothetical protein [Anabaena sp. 54]MTJ44864.1 hypothetical protein [Dolichospermum flos-aquae UHCC 0037]QSV70078.1 MAG: hypothetical protein HEQ20_03990 [Aphanizomenon flos-aquae KM1D3_PB]
MENPALITIVEELEACVKELEKSIKVIKVYDTHFQDDPESVFTLTCGEFSEVSRIVFKRLQTLQVRIITSDVGYKAP